MLGKKNQAVMSQFPRKTNFAYFVADCGKTNKGLSVVCVIRMRCVKEQMRRDKC